LASGIGRPDTNDKKDYFPPREKSSRASVQKSYDFNKNLHELAIALVAEVRCSSF